MTYHPIKQALCLRMNLPKIYWEAVHDKIPESFRAILDRYLSDFEDNLKMSAGFVLSGVPGIGKTSAAVYAAKAITTRINTTTMKHGKAYFIRASDLKEKVRNKEMFDEELSIFERCKQVDFLILDDLTMDDASSVWPGQKLFIELLSYRVSNSKSTFITTNLDSSQLKEHFPELLKTITGYMILVVIKGFNYRLAQHEELKKKLLGQS